MNEFDWDDLRLFLAVAQQGGLAAAAQKTGKSPATLGRRVTALEYRLGQSLFERQPRGYRLTEDGEALLKRAKEIYAQILPITEVETNARPLIKISAGTWETHFLAKNYQKICTDNARLQFLTSEDFANITHREAMIGIRNLPPDTGSLARRRIGEVEFAIYARDTKPRPFVRVLKNTPSALWVADQAVDCETIEVSSPRTALDFAVTGSAKVVLPTFIGQSCEGLREVSKPIEELRHDQRMVLHNEDRFLPQVRATIDAVYSVLKNAKVS